MIILAMLMMHQGLLCLLLAMPKYAKQVKGFSARDKQLSKTLSITGCLLLTASLLVLLTHLGIGNGLVWLCASLTFIGTLITLAFSLSSNFTTKWLLFMPVSLLQTSCGKVCLPFYMILFLLASLVIQ